MKERLQQFITATLLAIGWVSVHAVPIADANGPYSADEGSTLTLDGSGSSFATIFSWDLDNDGAFGDALGLTPSLVFDDDGLFTVGLEVSDGFETDSSTATVIINNVAPLVDAGLDVLLTPGASFLSAGSFTDPGADSWSATIDFGDGGAPAPLVLNLDGTFLLNHIYAGAPGTTFVGTVTVTDDDGGVGLDDFVVRFASVAEPSTIALTMVGLAGFGLSRRRKA